MRILNIQRPVIAFSGLLILLFIVTAFSADAAEFITSDGKVHQGEVEWRNNAFLVQGQVVAPETMVEVRFNLPPQKTDATGTMLTLVDGSVRKAVVTSSSLSKGLRIGGTLQQHKPLLHYTFDSLSKGVVKNLGTAGATFDGECTGGATLTTGKQGHGGTGEALSIADNSVQYIRPRTAVPTPSKAAYTISAWFQKLHPTDGWRTLTRANAGAEGHHVMVNAGSNDLGVYHGGFRNSGSDLAAGNAEWQHIAAVGRDGETMFYVGGKHVGTSSSVAGDNIYSIGNFYGDPQPFAEQIDDFSFFDRALSPLEIQSLVAGGVLSTNPEEHVPLSNIQSISFNPVRGTTAPKIPPFKDGQVHIVRIDGTVATGEFSYITSLLVGAKINGKRERFRRNALAAIHFRPPAAPKGDGVLVRTTLGARILGGMDELTSDGLAVKTSLGEVKIAMKNLISIERVGTHITPLSELQPATKKVTAFLDLVHPPQMNKDLFGFPLRAGAVTYDKGIAMHSRTELVFETKGAALFVGLVGLDTRYSRVGTANLTISLDGKPVSNVELAAGDPFQFIQLPLGNSKRLGLVLDFGELGSAGDHALILNPRLVKN